MKVIELEKNHFELLLTDDLKIEVSYSLDISNNGYPLSYEVFENNNSVFSGKSFISYDAIHLEVELLLMLGIQAEDKDLVKPFFRQKGFGEVKYENITLPFRTDDQCLLILSYQQYQLNSMKK